MTIVCHGYRKYTVFSDFILDVTNVKTGSMDAVLELPNLKLTVWRSMFVQTAETMVTQELWPKSLCLMVMLRN